VIAAGGQTIWAFSWHDVRDEVVNDADPDPYAISTKNLTEFFDYLNRRGYEPVSVQQLLDARMGLSPLPDKPVLLSFDDGLRSSYTRVFPLLKRYRFPAVVSVVTSWLELAADETVDFGRFTLGADAFLTAAQIREMQQSGLVEIASHTHDLHRGVRANPQGNEQPAAVSRVYAPDTSQYESQQAYHARLSNDLSTSRERIAAITGQAPRVLVWPYGEYSQESIELAEQLGMSVTLTLDERPATLDNLSALPRFLAIGNPSLAEQADKLVRWPRRGRQRIAHVDLDYVYDADPAQQERNLDQLVARMSHMRISDVYLQAFADADGDGEASALYFPNRHLPVQADLFNRVAWQLRTRAGVRIWAWMPVLAFHHPDAQINEAWSVKPLRPDLPEGEEYHRLSPFLPQARAFIAELYEDLGRSAQIDGVLFHDDAYLRDTEDGHAGPLSAKQRERALTDFTLELASILRRYHPELKTARNLYARPVVDPASQEWFAQSLTGFIQAYDYTALMAMPWMERADDPEAWLARLVETVLATPGGYEKVVFELQTRDWEGGRDLSNEEMAGQIKVLLRAGVRHIAYYPDDFIAGHPDQDLMRGLLANSTSPYMLHP
jgi:biofilm PGA synthesis lipoprotein PgaB